MFKPEPGAWFVWAGISCFSILLKNYFKFKKSKIKKSKFRCGNLDS